MSTLSHQPAIGAGASRGWTAVLGVTEFWASLVISVMWLAVLFVGVYGHDIVSNYGQSSVPSVVPVALFAGLATFPIARYGFGRNR
jgi:hypothetical protein